MWSLAFRESWRKAEVSGRIMWLSKAYKWQHNRPSISDESIHFSWWELRWEVRATKIRHECCPIRWVVNCIIWKPTWSTFCSFVFCSFLTCEFSSLLLFLLSLLLFLLILMMRNGFFFAYNTTEKKAKNQPKQNKCACIIMWIPVFPYPRQQC